MTVSEIRELAAKVGVLEAKRIINREKLRDRIKHDDLRSVLLELYPEIPRP